MRMQANVKAKEGGSRLANDVTKSNAELITNLLKFEELRPLGFSTGLYMGNTRRKNLF